ncbi:MAG: hypothetical protein J6U19_07910, partial [Oscillospiraceae bacterium]|nr:hypothetical protein [Oscillospiraceae bacterium]
KSTTKMTLRQQLRRMILHSAPGQTITGIGNLAQNYSVSNRHLLRVLDEFCEEGVLVHEKKGVYRIVKLPD